jgi:hypothetical protein
MELPKNESSFHYDHTGEMTGRNYNGTFTVRCVLNIAEKRILEIEKSTITADLNNPTGELNAIATVVANLRVRVQNAPDWFKQSIRSLDLLDDEVYFDIYSKCLEAENNWITEVKGNALGEQQAETTTPTVTPQNMQQQNSLQTT